MTGENLPDDLDLDADDGEDLVPALGPAPKFDVDNTLRAQNRALNRLLKRQNLVIKVMRQKFDDQGGRLATLERKEHDHERDQRFYQKIGAAIGAVLVALAVAVIGSLSTYLFGWWRVGGGASK